MLILREAHVGVTRFDQFRKNLGIAPTMLTKRLAALTDGGLLEKRLYSERPPREEYVLTPAGQDFLPVLLLFGAWAQRNCDGRFARFIDETTGQEIEPVGIDAVSGARLGSRPIKVSVEGVGSVSDGPPSAAVPMDRRHRSALTSPLSNAPSAEVSAAPDAFPWPTAPGPR